MLCIDKDKEYRTAYFDIAYIEYNINGNAENALKYYDKLLELHNDDLGSLYSKANLLRNEKRIDEALKIINSALEIDKKNSWFIDLKDEILHG